MLFGNPGAGKTRFIGTAPDPARTLILRPPTDHTDSIRDTGVKEWVIRDWSKMYEALEYLRETGGRDWDWVWLDSISLFQDTGLDDIWAGVIEKKPARKEYGLDRAEYGVNMFRLGQWVRHIVGMEAFHFGITAHPTEVVDPFDDGGVDMLMPYIQGKNMSPKICGYMNIVAYMDVRRNKKTNKLVRTIYTEGDKAYGKDQFGVLPDGKMNYPTIPKLLDLIYNGDK
jgi:hypothetical protein